MNICRLLPTLALVTLAAPAPLAAQTWQAGAAYQHDFINSSDPAWQDWQRWSASVVRRFEHGAVVLEGARAVRFAHAEWIGSVDAYRDLWQRAYANVRFAATPAAVSLPTADLYAELFHGLPAGWEVSSSYRYMHYDVQPVHALGAGIGYFTGDTYLRARIIANRQAGATGTMFTASARHGSRDDFIEAAAATGTEVALVSAAPLRELRSSTSALLRAQRFLGPNLGVGGAVGRTALRDVPHRTTLAANLLWRW